MKRIIINLFCFAISLCGFVALPEVMPGDTLNVAYKLHGQTRRFKFVYEPSPEGGIDLYWNIVRNLKLWEGLYSMSGEAVSRGDRQSYLMPEDGNKVKLDGNETFGMISVAALNELLEKGEFRYNGVLYERTGTVVSDMGELIIVKDSQEGGCMYLLNNRRLPLIVKMENNPLEINWEMTRIRNAH